MSQVVAVSIIRFNKTLEGSKLFFRIDEHTDAEKIRAVFVEYLNSRKDSIVNDFIGVRIDGEENLYLNARKRAFKEMVAHISFGHPINNMTKYFRIPDGFDEDMEEVNSYIRFDFQPIIEI